MQEKNIQQGGIFYKQPVIELKVPISINFQFHFSRFIYLEIFIYFLKDPKLLESLTPKPEKWKSYIWYNFERKYSFCGVAKVASSTWRSHNRDLVGHLRFDAFLKVSWYNKIDN